MYAICKDYVHKIVFDLTQFLSLKEVFIIWFDICYFPEVKWKH